LIEALRLSGNDPELFKELFRYQYVVSPKRLALPGMTTLKIGAFYLHAGEAARITTLLDRHGQMLGFVVGVAVDKRGALHGEWHLEAVDLTSSYPLEAVEDWLEDLAGRYTVIIHAKEEYRIYSDPVGMNGQCYNSKLRIAASSPFLCVDRPLVPNPLYDHDLVASGLGKISLFHTADTDVRRQNPNCSLDLANFQEYRFWPRERSHRHDPKDYEKIYADILQRVNHNISSVAQRESVAVPLTGGKDSRLLLALMKQETRKQVDLYFSYSTNYATVRDTVIAERLAETVGVPIKVFSAKSAPVFDRRETTIRKRKRDFGIASGRSGSLRDPHFKLSRFVPRDMVIMRGHQTDLLRAVFVPYADRTKWKNLSRQIRKLLIVPGNSFTSETYQKFEPYFRSWLQGLPPAAADKQLDFMFLEIYYNASLGVLFPASTDHFFMSPFNSRRLIADALGFDDEFRIQCGPVYDLIHRACPDLDPIPFDDETGPSLDELEDRDLITPAVQERLKATKSRAKFRNAAC